MNSPHAGFLLTPLLTPPLTKYTLKNLKLQSRKLLDTVSRDEEVVITYNRGKSCARLVPYQKDGKKIKKDALFGIWKEREDLQNVEEYVRRLRKRRF